MKPLFVSMSTYVRIQGHKSVFRNKGVEKVKDLQPGHCVRLAPWNHGNMEPQIGVMLPLYKYPPLC